MKKDLGSAAVGILPKGDPLRSRGALSPEPCDKLLEEENREKRKLVRERLSYSRNTMVNRIVLSDREWTKVKTVMKR